MIATTPPPLSTERHHEEASEFFAQPFNRHTRKELERNERIERFFPLVEQTIAHIRRRLPSHINADDLRSAGVTGLIEASERFDPAQASAFAGYACVRIRGAILDELRRIDPCSRRSRIKERKIQCATQEIAQSLGRDPTDEEVSARLQISATELTEWREATAGGHLVSLDVQLDSDSSSSGSLHEMIPDQGQECVRETLEKRELSKLVADRIAELPTMEKQVLALYYFEGMRFREIGAAFHLTESRISQIHRQAVTKLRVFISSAREK
jgi:RNA polymerase sigma factor FliA